MSHLRPPASERLPLLAAAFPRTFVADPKPVRPLKVNLHRDLNSRGAFPPRPARLPWLKRRINGIP